MKGYKRIRVFPDRDLRATRLEMAVIDCRVMQRLRDVRQLGQSFVAFPTAEHSRFSHVLGALYWTTKMLAHLKENFFSAEPGNVTLLKAANDVLKERVLGVNCDDERFGCEITWFEQLIRLAALLHDITHLPYGHTLEDQAGLLKRHDEDAERVELTFNRLFSELRDSPHLRIHGGAELHRILLRLLGQCRALYFVGLRLKHKAGPELVKTTKFAQWERTGKRIDEEFFPYLALVYDIVNNTVCADLIDYLHRDTLACGMPWTLDKVLFSHLKILHWPKTSIGQPSSGLFRLGVAVGRNGKLRHDVVTAVLSLLRARYDITEKVYYHHTKCAADAMLEKAIRCSELTLNWKTIVERDLGDEGIIHHLQEEFTGESASLLTKLRARRFHKAVYRLRRGPARSVKTTKAIFSCTNPSEDTKADCGGPPGRTRMEETIARECQLPAGAVIVSCLPWNMQLKEAKALVEWTDGRIFQLSELPVEASYLEEVENLTRRYFVLWSLTVYVDPAYEEYVAIVEGVCEKLFDHKNDALLAEYIRRRYPRPFERRAYIDSIVTQSEVAIVPQVNGTLDGHSDDDGLRIKQMMLDQVQSRIHYERLLLEPSEQAGHDSQTESQQLPADVTMEDHIAAGRDSVKEDGKSVESRFLDAVTSSGEDDVDDFKVFFERYLSGRPEDFQETFLVRFSQELVEAPSAHNRKGKASKKAQLMGRAKSVFDELERLRSSHLKDD